MGWFGWFGFLDGMGQFKPSGPVGKIDRMGRPGMVCVAQPRVKVTMQGLSSMHEGARISFTSFCGKWVG